MLKASSYVGFFFELFELGSSMPSSDNSHFIQSNVVKLDGLLYKKQRRPIEGIYGYNALLTI